MTLRNISVPNGAEIATHSFWPIFLQLPFRPSELSKVKFPTIPYIEGKAVNIWVVFASWIVYPHLGHGHPSFIGLNVKRICEPQPGGSQHISFLILSLFWLSFIWPHHYHFFIIFKFIIISFHFHFASVGSVGKPLSARPSEVFFAQGPIRLRQVVPCYQHRLCQS